MTASFFEPVPKWDMAKAQQFFDQHKLEQYTLLDVRQPEEFEQGHLPGATLIPLGELGQRLDELEQHKHKPMLVYCRSGGRAGNAVALLNEAGFDQAVNVGGSMQYSGQLATGAPDAGTAWFDPARPPEHHVALAWLLEEGAREFYQELARRFADHASLFADLATGEQHHKATLKRLYGELTGREGAPALADTDPQVANLMEGGIDRGEALAWLEGKSAADALDFSVALEANAHDRYIRIGRRLSAEGQRVFSQLAEAEKAHLDRLLETYLKAVS